MWEESGGDGRTGSERPGVKYEKAEGEASFYGPKIDAGQKRFRQRG